MSVTVDPATHAALQKVFICYRREESAPYAGRIYDAMVERFGLDNVFMDLDLDPGVDFVERITRVVSGCVALIVVIGPRWVDLQNEDGGRRIDDPEDFVRLEVETGLRRDDVTLIPVLVGGGRMPRREELPVELQGIARRNALEMSDGRWNYDVGRLLGTLDELLPDGVGPAPQLPQPQPLPPALGRRLVLEGMLVAGATAAIARLLGQAIPTAAEAEWKAVAEEQPVVDHEELSEVAAHIAGIVMRRTETLALVGGALAIWLARRVWHTDPLRHLLRALLVGGLAGLLGGLIWGALVYLPDKTVSLEPRAVYDLIAGVVSGGIIGSLVGWLWRPRRTGPGVVGGAAGAALYGLIALLSPWANDSTSEAVLSFGLGSAAVVGMALLALILSDRAETGTRAGIPPARARG